MRRRITALRLFDEAAASAGVAESSERSCGQPRRVHTVDECLWCAMVLQVLDLVNSAHEAFYGDCPATSFSIDSSSIANTSTLLSGNKPCPVILVGYRPCFVGQGILFGIY
jgi:hypothetical protein